MRSHPPLRDYTASALTNSTPTRRQPAQPPGAPRPTPTPGTSTHRIAASHSDDTSTHRRTARQTLTNRENVPPPETAAQPREPLVCTYPPLEKRASPSHDLDYQRPFRGHSNNFPRRIPNESTKFLRNHPTQLPTRHLVITNPSTHTTRSRRKLTHSPSRIQISTQGLIRKKNLRVDCFSISALAKTLLSISLFAEQAGGPGPGRMLAAIGQPDTRFVSGQLSGRPPFRDNGSRVGACAVRPRLGRCTRSRGELRPRRRLP